MSSHRRPGLEVIEAMIWKTGTRNELQVRELLRAIRDYAEGIAEQAERLPAARAQVLVLDRDGATGSATLAELLDPDGDGSEWWPR